MKSRILERHQNGYWNISEMSDKLGITYSLFHYTINIGMCPGPSHLIGSRRYYHEKEIPSLKEYLQRRHNAKEILKTAM